MREPRRLEQVGHVAVRTLMRAGRAELPSAELYRSTLVALGVAASATTVLASSMVAKAAAAATSTQAVAGSATAGTALLMAKWTAVGLATAVAVSGAAVATYEATAPAPPAARTTSTEAGSRAARRPLPASVTPSPSSAPVEPSVATDRPVVREPAFRDVPSMSSELDRELARLGRARSLLASGAADEALAALDSYDRDLPGGHLRAEAMYLRMEALCQQGNRTAAQNAARRLLYAYPKGPHAAKARSILEMDAE